MTGAATDARRVDLVGFATAADVSPRLTRPLRVLDLYSGLGSDPKQAGGWGKAFRERGHQVLTLDWEPKFRADLVLDIREFARDPQKYLKPAAFKAGFTSSPDEEWWPDVVLASPDCTTFSTLANGHWEVTGPRKAKVRRPVSEAAVAAIDLVRVTLELIAFFEAKATADGRPFWWWMENPVGMLAQVAFMAAYPRATVHYCSYGFDIQKPTHLWGRHPLTWKPRGPLCAAGDPCHLPGDEGVVAMANAAIRALVPYELSLDACLAVEQAGEEGHRTTDEGVLRRMAADLVLADVFGSELKRWRQSFHVSQSELAAHLAINPSVISDYESGRRPSPGVATVRGLARALLEMDERRGGGIVQRQAVLA